MEMLCILEVPLHSLESDSAFHKETSSLLVCNGQTCFSHSVGCRHFLDTEKATDRHTDRISGNFLFFLFGCNAALNPIKTEKNEHWEAVCPNSYKSQ